MIKHSVHLRTLEKCTKHSLAVRIFYISFVFSNARRVLSQCNAWLRLLYLLNIIVYYVLKRCTKSRSGYFRNADLRILFSSNNRSNPHLKSFQISSPQYLVDNKVYYIEVLLKQGIGNDGMVVGIQTPSGEMKAPIPGENLLKSITEKRKLKLL